jgi:hypothetical protein
VAQSKPKPVTDLAAMMQEGRLARIIELLWENKDFITATDKGQITFDWAGSSVATPKITLRPSSSKK